MRCGYCGKEIDMGAYSFDDYVFKHTFCVGHKARPMYFCGYTCRAKKLRLYEEEKERRKKAAAEKRRLKRDNARSEKTA